MEWETLIDNQLSNGSRTVEIIDRHLFEGVVDKLIQMYSKYWVVKKIKQGLEFSEPPPHPDGLPYR